MDFVFATGGREKYFTKANVGDCVCRAIANATNMDYKEVYDLLNKEAKNESHKGKRQKFVSSARNGYRKDTERKVLKSLGWIYVPCMGIGTGCKVHLKANELPSGTIIVNVSKHLTCVKDGVIYDTYDCSREESRCVYGYYRKMTKEELKAESEIAKSKEEELQKKEAIKKAKAKIRAEYSKKIKALNQQIAKLEKERDKKLNSFE